MATVASPYHERRSSERRRIAYPGLLAGDGMKVSWGGIFGGVLVAVGLLILLTTLGIAVGIAAVDNADAAKLGTGAGIWAGVSLLLALFVGGMVATRIGATVDSTTAFFSGFLVWIVAVVLMAYITASGLSRLTGGAFEMFASSAPAVVQELPQKGPELQQKAQEVKPQASAAAWTTFGALVVSLLAAVIGAAAGRRRRQPISTGT
ncbi:MAG TPA: hypothetical protein VFK84_10545 [Burkholderiales bacterium]|nr:hypothetical protein [Burkholderiales bacterium]